MKNFFAIITTIAAVSILVVGGYYFRTRQEASPAGEVAITPGGLPAAANNTTAPQTETKNTAQQNQQGQQTQQAQRLLAVTQGPALDYFIDKGSNAFVVQPDGRVVKIAAGTSNVLSNGPVSGIISASFSPDGKKAFAIAKGTSGNQLEVFDVDGKSWSLAANNVQSAAWSPDGHTAAFVIPGDNGGVYSIDTANVKAKQVEIMKMRQEDLSVAWPWPSTMVLGDAASASWSSSLWSLDTVKKSISPMMTDRFGLETIWSSSSPAFGLAMISGNSGNGGSLRLVDKNGAEKQSLSFTTLPSKCAFYSKTMQPQGPTAVSSTKPQAPKVDLFLACAIPRNRQLLANNPLPDAYQKKSFFTSDDLFDINVSTGDMKNFFNDSSKNLDADNMKVFNQALYFVNRLDQRVYSVQLPK